METPRLLLINPNTNTETTREMVQIALHEAESSGTAVQSHCMHLNSGVLDLSIYPNCPDLRIVCSVYVVVCASHCVRSSGGGNGDSVCVCVCVCVYACTRTI